MGCRHGVSEVTRSALTMITGPGGCVTGGQPRTHVSVRRLKWVSPGAEVTSGHRGGGSSRGETAQLPRAASNPTGARPSSHNLQTPEVGLVEDPVGTPLGGRLNSTDHASHGSGPSS